MEYKEPKGGDSNNEFPSTFKKDEGDERANGMGLHREVEALNKFPGSAGFMQEELYDRESARYEDLARKAFGRDIPITNAGIVLDSFGGAFGETGERVNRGAYEDTKGEEEK